MRTLLLAAFIVLTAAGIASAGEEKESIAIKIEKSGDGSDHTAHWIGDAGDLNDLAVGESKTLKDGVTVTRTDDGLTFDINGEAVVVPEFDGHANAMAFVSADGFGEDVDVNVEVLEGGPHFAVKAHPAHNGIMIASGKAIDETTQETIRSVLASAGYDDEVMFVDRSQHTKHVKVIKKRIEKVHEQ